jgi:hypothetical protein
MFNVMVMDAEDRRLQCGNSVPDARMQVDPDSSGLGRPSRNVVCATLLAEMTQFFISLSYDPFTIRA